MSSPRAQSPANVGSTTARPASPKPPGGPATVMRRKAAADRAEKTANQRPSSTRSAGAGGSSSTMLRLYTDESPGLKVDPVVVMTLSVVFIFSVVALHGMLTSISPVPAQPQMLTHPSHCQGYAPILSIRTSTSQYFYLSLPPHMAGALQQRRPLPPCLTQRTVTSNGSV
ncbi:unnamed protein product [Periconia digitata]|uniref:Protein transport protein Sec61 subunit beta n=1 Tax=Periconia digitata TaxID=1303443 RepID=A0A9W4UK12_9PLEO|nr:unnamed protein product [Periconia digitata]